MIQLLGFSGRHHPNSGLLCDFFSTYVQFHDFTGPDQWKLQIQHFSGLIRTHGNRVLYCHQSYRSI